MTIHEELSERMPGVARGEADWTAEEAAHLAACAGCGKEWALIRGAVALGRLAPGGGDPALLLAGVQGRLRAARWADRRERRWGAGMAVAAAAVLAFMVLTPRQPRTPPEAPEPSVTIFLPELDSLSTDELGAVLRRVEGPLADLRDLDADGPGDLDDQQLADILHAMEG